MKKTSKSRHGKNAVKRSPALKGFPADVCRLVPSSYNDVQQLLWARAYALAGQGRSEDEIAQSLQHSRGGLSLPGYRMVITSAVNVARNTPGIRVPQGSVDALTQPAIQIPRKINIPSRNFQVDPRVLGSKAISEMLALHKQVQDNQGAVRRRTAEDAREMDIEMVASWAEWEAAGPNTRLCGIARSLSSLAEISGVPLLSSEDGSYLQALNVKGTVVGFASEDPEAAECSLLFKPGASQFSLALTRILIFYGIGDSEMLRPQKG